MRLEEIKTPSYIIDEDKLKNNLEILSEVEKKTGCKILLAQKAFSNYAVYPLIAKYISGTTASGLYEARLGKEEMGKENHVFSPAYKKEDMSELVKICDHIIFNSFSQFNMHKEACRDAGVSVGIRINPQCSTQGDHAIYDPCAFGSRLGVTISKFDEYVKKNGMPSEISGIHFHTLCEQNSDALETTLEAVEEKFGKYLKQMKWVNFGGGHHITRNDYDVEKLIGCVKHIREKYDVEVYLEPGEAIALNAGYLITSVLDKVENGIETLILDASAACHMPDVLEMPYTPPLENAVIVDDILNEKDRTNCYRLSSYTCLAGDIIGDYRFENQVNIGDRLIFDDMAIYSMVKNNTFNGIPLPDIVLKSGDDYKLIKRFDYDDFKSRL